MDQTINTTENSSISESRRQTLLQNVCLELVYLLKDQDVNGYFLYPLPHSRYSESSSHSLGLLDVEKQVYKRYYKSLSEFQEDIIGLLTGAVRYYQVESMAYNEAQRLLNLSNDWFNSLPPEYVINLSHPDDNSTLVEKDAQTERPDNTGDNGLIPKETYLKILNPDNSGIINKTERVQSIGDEAGHLYSGSFLLPTGGYREDRRNKVIPYTYLDYGPYYSFAPIYDSGASHCTPESNQLLLGTTWLPARTPFMLGKRSLDGFDSNSGLCNIEITDETISTVLEMGDQQLAVSLAVAESEQRTAEQMSSELEDIIPGPDVPDEFVFSMCLANTFTRDLIKKEEERCDMDSNDSCNEFKESKTLTNGETSEDCVGSSVASCDLDSISHHNLADSNISTYSGDQNNINDMSQLETELIKSSEDLNALYCAQYLRLSDTSQAANHGSTIQPNSKELSIAHRLTERLIKLTKCARPQDLIQLHSVRKAMGLNPDDYFLPEDFNSTDNLVVGAE
ncbi:unnamed protein product [Trichobilharzia szidati]|nr:unnamed protein product [Trichobilharzia szidati]